MRLLLLILLFLSLTACDDNLVTQGTAPSDDAFGSLEPTSTGRTFYVSGTGNDSNDGLSQSRPFRTIDKAASLTQPGDTVLVMNGIYSKAGPNTNVVEIKTAGTPTNYITYKAFPGHKPVIEVNNNYAGIKIVAPYIVVAGFTVEGNAPALSSNTASALARGTNSAAALDNTLYNSSGIASYPENGQQPHHVLIRNNTVFNHPGGGIFSDGSDYVRIENNVVYNNSNYSPYAKSGISFFNSKPFNNKTGIKMWVRNNVSYNNENKVPFWFSNESDPAKRTITDGNGVIIDESRKTGREGGEAYNGTFLIENNIIYGNGGRAVNVFSSSNVIVRNNTTFRNGATKGFTEIAVVDASNVKVYGNIFIARPDRKLVSYSSTSNVMIENNLFYGGTEAPSLPSPEQAAKNIIGRAPLFVDESGLNFKLTKQSPAVDAQTTPAPSRDKQRTNRPQGAASDLGAYESF